jgi:hypothetical protein
MSGVHCYTGVTLACLDRARVLAETVRRHHPDWTLWLCLTDREPAGFRVDPAEELFDHLVRIEQLEIPNLDQWIFGHDAAGLRAAVKGPMLCHLLARGAGKVIGMDPDIALFDSIGEVCDLLERCTIVLTPPPTARETEDGGALSLGPDVGDPCFIAVKGDAEGMHFARRWRDRLVQFDDDDAAGGLSPHRHLCDLIPSFAAGTYVLCDPGYDAGSNLARRPIEIALDGSILAGGRPLRVFRFTDVDPRNEARIEHHCAGRHELFELLRWYRERLGAHAVRNLPSGWWAFARYEDGTPVERAHRAVYRRRRDLRETFPHPFASGPGSYQAWCAGQGETMAG